MRSVVDQSRSGLWSAPRPLRIALATAAVLLAAALVIGVTAVVSTASDGEPDWSGSLPPGYLAENRALLHRLLVRSGDAPLSLVVTVD
jgi:hypothetical protein